jgi:hypothetical protein
LNAEVPHQSRCSFELVSMVDDPFGEGSRWNTGHLRYRTAYKGRLAFGSGPRGEEHVDDNGRHDAKQLIPRLHRQPRLFLAKYRAAETSIPALTKQSRSQFAHVSLASRWAAEITDELFCMARTDRRYAARIAGDALDSSGDRCRRSRPRERHCINARKRVVEGLRPCEVAAHNLDAERKTSGLRILR